MQSSSDIPASDPEALRLAALARYDILDTPREKDFDDVAELASEICGTPIAVVSMIDRERQFFKAEVGLGISETSLDVSFCAKAILEEDFMVVPDATHDPRFACNPLVVGEPKLRFYAGALLKTTDGVPIGTICVLDYEPRELTELQTKTLRVLARQVMKQLELRRAIQERDRAEAEQRFLNQELSHRLKNTLAMVHAIATQTLRNVSDRDAVDAFEQRIVALGKAHDVLLQQTWSAAPIQTVVDGLLDLYVEHDRFHVTGPDINLGPKATLSLALVLHELATNAIKHGALSTQAGRVELDWRVEGEPADSALVLRWTELDGPAVREPSRKGFGSRLIEMGLAGTGGVTRTYASTGFHAEFRSPLASLQEV